MFRIGKRSEKHTLLTPAIIARESIFLLHGFIGRDRPLNAVYCHEFNSNGSRSLVEFQLEESALKLSLDEFSQRYLSLACEELHRIILRKIKDSEHLATYPLPLPESCDFKARMSYNGWSIRLMEVFGNPNDSRLRIECSYKAVSPEEFSELSVRYKSINAAIRGL